MKSIIIFVLSAFALHVCSAQNILKTTNQKISGKAATGKWLDYSIDEAANSISFSFETKTTKKKSLFEHYKFNLNLDYLGMEEEEILKEKIRTRFRLFASKPDSPLLRVKKNFATGQMVMETGYLSYSYAGRALMTNFVVQNKNKPKGDDGDRLILIHSRTESPFYYTQFNSKFFGQSTDIKRSTTLGSGAGISYNEGDVCAIVYKKSIPAFQDYAFVVYDSKTFGRKITKEFKLDYSMRPLYARDMPNGDMALIFEPVLKVDLPKTAKAAKKYKVQTESTFKYMRINMQGEILADVDFKLAKNKVGRPYVFTLIPDTDSSSDNVYIAAYGNPDFLGGGGLGDVTASWAATGNNLPRATNFTANKVSDVILAKVSGNKMVYMNKINPDKFFQGCKTNGAKVPSGKDAGKFFLGNLAIKEALSINGKDFLVGTNITDANLFVIQMDSNAGFERTYLTESLKGNYIIDATIVPQNDGSSRVIYTYQPQGKSDFENREKDFERSLSVLNLNPKSGNLGKPNDILPKKHFVDPVDPFRFLSNNEILVLGHSSRKDITLVKVKL